MPKLIIYYKARLKLKSLVLLSNFPQKMLNLEQQIFNLWEKSSNILIVFPADKNRQGGDFLSSALGLKLFFKALGKEVEVAGYLDRAGDFKFLPGYQEISSELSNLRRFIVSLDISQAKISQIKYTVDQERLNFIISPKTGWFKAEDVSTRAGTFKYDLIISIGAPDLESLGKIYDDNIEFFYKTNIINIDHQAENEEFGQINFIDLNAVANGEILFYLLKNYRPDILNEDIATCLLAGIIQKTKNFKTTNITPRTLLTTSELVALGARREEIVDHLYRSRDLKSLKLWGRLLNNLRSEKNGEILWSALSFEDFKNTNASSDSLNDIIDELITSIPDTKIVAIFYEEIKNETQAIIYSLKNINALDLLKNYAPTGTIKIAHLSLKEDLKPAANSLLNFLKEKLDKLSS